MKLSVKGFALTGGIIWGVSMFLLTLISLWRGHGGHVGLLNTVYLGYTVSYIGSVVGLAYGFVDGLITGAIFAWLYNRLA